MLKELFDSIQKSAIDGAKPQPIKLELPNGVTRVFSQDGKTEDLIFIPDRKHLLGSVDQVGPFVSYHTETRSADPVVWYNDLGVAVVLNDATGSRRNDIALLAFKPTEEFRFVTELTLDDPEFLNTNSMIRMLRQNLWDAFTSESKRDNLIKLLRSVRFDDDNQGAKFGTVKRSMISTADGDVEFPDTVELSLRPLDDPALTTKFKVKCHFEVDPDSKSFALIPIKSELKRAVDDALSALQELLTQNVKCPIFRGSPW